MQPYSRQQWMDPPVSCIFAACMQAQSHLEITGGHLPIDHIAHLLGKDSSVSLGADVISRIAQGRAFLDAALNDSERTWYGINTGFGSLYDRRISHASTAQLQLNLIRSHAAGAGPIVPYPIARLVLLLKIISFCPGHSGVRIELVRKLIEVFNAGLAPAMYQFGSLGASGDLAPLAHLALNLIGEGGFVSENGAVLPAADVFRQHGIDTLTLEAKEGLALINGTQFSTAYGLWALMYAMRLADLADCCAALALDAFNGNPQPFDRRIHALRPHTGQRYVAEMILGLLEGSGIAAQEGKQLQDPYAFRCVPQVHGASRDVIAHCRQILDTEIHSVTDNPLIFPEDGEILSGGNFHGQPIAMAMDYLAIALAEYGSISERRTYQLVSGHRGLPEYLTRDAGLESGLMIAQYTAASIVNRNKILCTPASIDSIPSSKGQEDHVSMSANAATKLHELCENVHTILAIEFMTAMRALDFRAPSKTSPVLERIREAYRIAVPVPEGDCALEPLISSTRTFTTEIQQYLRDIG